MLRAIVGLAVSRSRRRSISRPGFIVVGRAPMSVPGPAKGNEPMPQGKILDRPMPSVRGGAGEGVVSQVTSIVPPCRRHFKREFHSPPPYGLQAAASLLLTFHVLACACAVPQRQRKGYPLPSGAPPNPGVEGTPPLSPNKIRVIRESRGSKRTSDFRHNQDAALDLELNMLRRFIHPARPRPKLM